MASSVLLLPATSAAQAFEDSPKVVLDEAWQIVQDEYVDGSFNHVDWEATRQTLLSRQYTSRESAYGALREALGQLNDPYTRFLDPREYAELSEQTSGEVSGIGLQLQRNTTDNSVIISEVVADSPADQAGLRSGEVLLVIDGQATTRLTISDIFQRLRGEAGTQVTVTVSREGVQRTVVMPRARLEIPTVEHAIHPHGSFNLGYIRLMEFNAHAPEQMSAAIVDLVDQDVDGFVLDLRGNPGGLLGASIDISRMWLHRGDIVQTVDRDGHSESVRANHSALTDLPLTVLVDGRSASSSEILTGALRDNNRATVVGSITYGKALVQSLHGLSDGSGLTVTVAHYYTPNGTDISRKGITPDIQVDLSAQQRQSLFSDSRQLGTASDPQYVRAAQALTQALAEGQSSSQISRNESAETP
ncbi:peptidase S41 [filamentous cyanobacterium CCP5]|nr:peptidase S41 [filamentous cyanobacterium CCP5]